MADRAVRRLNVLIVDDDATTLATLSRGSVSTSATTPGHAPCR